MHRINNDGMPTVYVVAWPNENIVKAGYTTRDRWKPFVSRGAVLLKLESYVNATEALQREAYLENAMMAEFERAFTERSQALPILGKGGGGYSECYRASVEEALVLLRG